jgi:hypothetical protein
METRKALHQVGAIATAAGTVVAGAVVDAEPVAAHAERSVGHDTAAGEATADVVDGWASLAAPDAPDGAAPLCYLLGPWEGPKRVSSGAIRGRATFACARPFGGYFLWEAVLQRRAGSTWQGYGDAEADICAAYGDVDLCGVTDGGPYRAGTYRIRATLAYAATGGHAYAYSPAVTIR